MLSRCGVAALAGASLVGVVGWPVLAVISYAWLTELQPTDLLWWAVGGVIATAAYLQLMLARRLWRYLDPRA